MAQALGKTAAKRRTGRRSPRAAVAGRKETTRNVTPSRRTTDRPDLYIGLVCAAGTDLTDVKNQLRAQLSVVGYRYEEIKVSTTIAELLEIKAPDDEYERILRLMRAGDLLRSNSDDGEGVAAAIVAEIRRRRDGDTLPRSTAYVIDSLKNPAEIKLLDQIYGRNYYTVSIYLPKEDRRTSLKNKIAQGRHQPPGAAHESLADELISEDERGIGARSQNVQDSFPKADFFVNATEDVAGQVKRFVELIFREPFTTPTPDEFHMFVAKAAALRSCDLSRQVGAVIVDPCKSIISTGCNEVPYPDGGIFYEGRLGGIGDNRDYTKGHDPNYIEIQRTLIEFIGLLQESGHIQSKDEPSAIADGLLHGQYRELMSNARIRNLIDLAG
jgi:deoxycytidylate deaminase